MLNIRGCTITNSEIIILNSIDFSRIKPNLSISNHASRISCKNILPILIHNYLFKVFRKNDVFIFQHFFRIFYFDCFIFNFKTNRILELFLRALAARRPHHDLGYQSGFARAAS